MSDVSRTRLEDDDDGERVLYTPARLAAVAGVVVLVAAATALLEAAFLRVVLVGVVGVAFLLVTGLGSAFVQEPAELRDHLLVVAAAVLFPALTLAILYGTCRMRLPFDAPGCAPALAQRVVLLNFFFPSPASSAAGWDIGWSRCGTGPSIWPFATAGRGTGGMKARRCASWPSVSNWTG